VNVDNLVRENILQTGKRLFIQQGYYGISMRAIAEEVGVSKAALYYHFQDKQELFLAILDESLDEIEHLLDECLETEDQAAKRIERFVQQILSQPTEQRSVIRLANQELNHLDETARQAFEARYRSKFLDKIQKIFTEGVAQGELRQFDPGVLTWSLLGMLYPYFYTSPVKQIQNSETLASQLTAIFFQGARFAG
jgi:AcrR family transcriptional regulator